LSRTARLRGHLPRAFASSVILHHQKKCGWTIGFESWHMRNCARFLSVRTVSASWTKVRAFTSSTTMKAQCRRLLQQPVMRHQVPGRRGPPRATRGNSCRTTRTCLRIGPARKWTGARPSQGIARSPAPTASALNDSTTRARTGGRFLACAFKPSGVGIVRRLRQEGGDPISWTPWSTVELKARVVKGRGGVHPKQRKGGASALPSEKDLLPMPDEEQHLPPKAVTKIARSRGLHAFRTKKQKQKRKNTTRNSKKRKKLCVAYGFAID
jgi:hypothetical protein